VHQWIGTADGLVNAIIRAQVAGKLGALAGGGKELLGILYKSVGGGLVIEPE
jgi:hypothetical protein